MCKTHFEVSPLGWMATPTSPVGVGGVVEVLLGGGGAPNASPCGSAATRDAMAAMEMI